MPDYFRQAAGRHLALYSIVCCILAWVIPNHYYPWAAFYNDFFFGLSIFLLALYVLLSHRSKTLTLPTACSVLFVVSLLPLFQWCIGKISFVGDAYIASLYLSGFGCAYCVGYLISGHHVAEAMKYISATVLGGALLSTTLAIAQWLSIDTFGMWLADLPFASRPYANLGQPNNLATLLMLGLVSCLYLHAIGVLRRWVGVAIYLVFGVALTQSRTAWLMFGLLGCWWVLRRGGGLTPIPAKYFAVLILSYGLFFSVVTDVHAAYFMMSGGVGSGWSLGTSGRYEIWMQMYKALCEMPLFGYGWNQVSVAQVSVAENFSNHDFVGTMTEYSHNLLLDLLIWNGWLVGLTLIYIVCAWCVSRAAAVRTLESSFALLLVATLLVHAMLEYPLAYAYFLFPLGVFLGVVDREIAVRVMQIRMSVAVVVVAGLGFMLGWVWNDYRAVEEDYRLMRFETARIGSVVQVGASPDVNLLTQLREFIRFARTEESDAMTGAEISWMQMVAHRYPYVPSLSRSALALGLNGYEEAAAIELARLKALHGDVVYLSVLNKLDEYEAGRQSADVNAERAK